MVVVVGLRISKSFKAFACLISSVAIATEGVVTAAEDAVAAVAVVVIGLGVM